jgi:hypothetical protein
LGNRSKTFQRNPRLLKSVYTAGSLTLASLADARAGEYCGVEFSGGSRLRGCSQVIF